MLFVLKMRYSSKFVGPRNHKSNLPTINFYNKHFQMPDKVKYRIGGHIATGKNIHKSPSATAYYQYPYQSNLETFIRLAYRSTTNH